MVRSASFHLTHFWPTIRDNIGRRFHSLCELAVPCFVVRTNLVGTNRYMDMLELAVSQFARVYNVHRLHVQHRMYAVV